MTPSHEREPLGEQPGSDSAQRLIRLRHGVVGGLLGGLVFALLMLVNGTLVHEGMMTLPLIGRLVGRASIPVGLLVHMTNSALIGALFVLIFSRVGAGMIDGLHFGLVYGLAWWFVGPMTLMPLALGMDVGSLWSLANVFRTFPSLIGHLVFGAILGMTVGAFRDASLAPDARPEEPADRFPDLQPVEDAPAEAHAPEIVAAPAAPLPGPVPVWITTGAIAVVFLLNILVFGYALTRGLPHAHIAETATAPSEPTPAAAPATPAPEGAPAATTGAPAAAPAPTPAPPGEAKTP